jgi:2-dehydro-3-deoxygluconokinase
MAVILCFGELLLRFSPDSGTNWLNNNNINFNVAGAEANVAAALAQWGIPVKYCTALPENYLSRHLTAYLQRRNIDVSGVLYREGRIGLYYLPEDADLKNQSVIYDRKDSAFANLRTGMIDWDAILTGVNWLHMSAISPALSEEVALVCIEGLKKAVAKQITTSVDLNYRSKLWQYGRQPFEIMPQLVEQCDIIMGNIWSAAMLLNIPLKSELQVKNKNRIYLEQSEEMSRGILSHYPRCKTVANTFRLVEGEEIKYYATLLTDGQLYVSREYSAIKVVDKVGSGDCFMAGLIYGYQNHLPPQRILEFATAAAFQKLFVKGDFTDKTVTAINAAIKP